VYAESIEPNLQPGDALFFAHGFNIRFGYITPPPASTCAWSPRRARATWCAASTPRAAASRHRRRRAGRHRQRLAAGAVVRQGIGGLRAGGIKTTFTEETETDLFGEQAVLCGGVSALVQAGFETLVEAGYQPEVAYFECLHELKLIVDLMYEGGIAKQRWSISDTAEYGDYVSGPRVIDAQREGEHEGRAVRHPVRRVRQALHRRPGRRAPGVQEPGCARKHDGEQHPIEATGRELRGVPLMAWVKPSHDDDYVEGTAAR
jgi:ketol-acid reductoisomerase